MRYSTKRLVCIVVMLVLTITDFNFIQTGQLLNWRIEGTWYLLVAGGLIAANLILICMAIYYDYKDKKASLQ